MGLLGFLQFLVKYSVDVIAWPLLALAFPLFASIRAIESNSFADTQKLNTYWVVFSLILLLEHVLSLYQWFPFWHYLRLIIVCLLVIPSFDGAFYVYKQVTSSLLSMDAQIIINWFNKPKEASAETQKILAKVEKYVRENGAEALEEIIADKSGSSKDPDVKEIKAFPSIDNEVVNQPNSNGPYVARKGIKAVEEIEKNEVKAAMLSGSTKDPDVKEIEAAPSIDNEVVNQPNSNKPYVARKGIKAVEEIEKNEVKAAMLSGSTKDPDVKEIKAAPSVDNEVVNQATSNGLNVARKDIQAVEEIEKNEVKAAMQVSRVEPEVTRTKNITTLPSETREKFDGVQTGGELPQTPVSNIVQRNWECAIRKKTLKIQGVFDSHLQGKKHKRAMDKAVKAKNETLSPKTFDNSAVEDPGRSSNNQTVFPKVIFSHIPKQFDQSTYSPGNISNVSSSGWEPSVVSGGQSDQSTYSPGNISNVSSSRWEPSVISGGQSDQSTYYLGNMFNESSSRWEPSVISGGQSDQSTYLPGNISNVSSSRWEPSVISGGQSDQSTYWLGNMFNESSSGWEPSVISGGQSDRSTYWPGNISNVSSSGWDPSVISGWQSDRSTYWPGNMFNESSSGWEPSVISGGQSDRSTYWPGNMFNVSSSGWELSGIAGKRFQGKPKNVVPGQKPMKQKKVTVGPNDLSLWCEICNVRCDKANMKAHRRGKKHLTKVRSLAKK